MKANRSGELVRDLRRTDKKRSQRQNQTKEKTGHHLTLGALGKIRRCGLGEKTVQ